MLYYVPTVVHQHVSCMIPFRLFTVRVESHGALHCGLAMQLDILLLDVYRVGHEPISAGGGMITMATAYHLKLTAKC